MIDTDTFLTTLYLITDDFRQESRPGHKGRPHRPGPDASLSAGEVITLAIILARWSRFASERDFYRYADGRLPDAFPTLPDRSQFNRLARHYLSLIEAFASRLVEIMEARKGCPHEALDSSAMPVRDAKRRGEGWLAGRADIGWSNRLGWHEGFRLLVAVNPVGMVTGFGFRAASATDQQAAETFFAARHRPEPASPSVGRASSGPYVTDKGFEGAENHQRWLDPYGARVIHSPKRNRAANDPGPSGSDGGWPASAK